MANPGDYGSDSAPTGQAWDSHTSCGGIARPSTVDYPLPPDPNTPSGKDYASGSDAEISDYGLNETVEVGYDGCPNDYGLTGSKDYSSGKAD